MLYVSGCTIEFRSKAVQGGTDIITPRLLMRWKMSNVAVVAIAAAAALMLVTAETVAAASGGGGSSSGGGGGGGGEQQRGAAAAAAAADRQDIDIDDESTQTPSAVQCSSCLAHEGIKTLSIELIKASILNKLGMQRPPEFGDRRPPKVPTDLPPLQDLMRKYNTDRDRDGSVVVIPHIRHKAHHYEPSVPGGNGGAAEMQSDEAAGYAVTPAATPASEDTNNNNNYGGNGGGGDDEDDDYHLKTHKLIAFAQPRKCTNTLNIITFYIGGTFDKSKRIPFTLNFDSSRVSSNRGFRKRFGFEGFCIPIEKSIFLFLLKNQ